MWLRTLIVGACLLLGACSGTPIVRIARPPAPPAWVMQPCPPWPTLPGEGRVDVQDAARVVAEAKVTLATCEARHEGLMHYVREVVQPDNDQ